VTHTNDANNHLDMPNMTVPLPFLLDVQQHPRDDNDNDSHSQHAAACWQPPPQCEDDSLNMTTTTVTPPFPFPTCNSAHAVYHHYGMTVMTMTMA